MTIDIVGAAPFALEVSLRAAAAAVAVAIVLELLHVRAAAVRHSAWTAVLVAMLLMPVLPSIVPPLPLPLPDRTVAWLAPAAGPQEALARASADTTSNANQPGDLLPRAGGSEPVVGVSPVALSAARPPSTWLPVLLLSLYAAGVLLLASRLLYGWWLAAAMVRCARRQGAVHLEVAARAYQSSSVTVPVTVGAFRPVIVLPTTWTTWDAETLAAIAAHEAAHVRRRDGLINFVAHLNRAIFWFHPLAWWLARTLAVTAEHACDEAAARAIAAPRRYAEILVDMADLVRRSRGRLAWQAVGVSGAGHLDTRIDRLLGDEAFATASKGKKIAAWMGCLLAISVVVACRPQPSATPLREDPEFARRIADRDARTARFQAARDMTQGQADALEQRLAKNPEDFDAREQLVTYYSTSAKVPWERKVPGLRRHALWLIEHHPEHEVRAPVVSPEFDPEGFAAARKLWDTHLARPDVTPFLVYRAASFFAPHDKPYAEQLILRGMAMDPQSAALAARMPPDVGGYEWPMQLASLYAAALRGSESVFGTYNDLRTHPDRLDTPFAREVQRKLEATRDAKLLARVGNVLARTRPGTPSDAGERALQQSVNRVRALGVRYLERALALDPGLASAKATLVRIGLADRVTDADRLANRAHEQYMVAEDITEYAKKDMAAGKRQRDEAEARAEEVLKLAAAHANDPAYSAAVMTAHQVLATSALRDGDRERAVRHLQESVKVPTSEQIQYALPFSWNRPVNRLLREGERERIAEFLEALAALTVTERDRLMKDAQAIRDGRMPTSYQSMVAREAK